MNLHRLLFFNTNGNTNASNISETFIPNNIDSVVTTPAQSDTASMVSGITQAPFQELQKDNRELRGMMEMILSRLPPQQTGESTGSLMARQGGSTADDLASSTATP